jgi:hypothetical protein
MKASSCPASPSFKKETNWCVHERMNGKRRRRRKKKGIWSCRILFRFILFVSVGGLGLGFGNFSFLFLYLHKVESCILECWECSISDKAVCIDCQILIPHFQSWQMYPNSVYKAKKPNQQIPQNPSAQSFIIIVIMVMVFFLGVAAAARKQASKPKLFCGKT